MKKHQSLDPGLNHMYDLQQMFPVKDLIAQLKMSMQSKQQELVQIECQGKPNLRTFIMFKDFQTIFCQ